MLNRFNRLLGECRAFNGLWIVNYYVHRSLETTHWRMIHRAICQVITADASGFFLNHRLTTSAAWDSYLIDSVGFFCICFGERGYQAGGCSLGIRLSMARCETDIGDRNPHANGSPALSAHICPEECIFPRVSFLTIIALHQVNWGTERTREA